MLMFDGTMWKWKKYAKDIGGKKIQDADISQRISKYESKRSEKKERALQNCVLCRHDADDGRRWRSRPPSARTS